MGCVEDVVCFVFLSDESNVTMVKPMNNCSEGVSVEMSKVISVK